MKNIEIISAGAGSGKTWRLAKELRDAVMSNSEAKKARPEAVIATTFTRKAAGELRERVRTRLLEERKSRATAMAQRLVAARIGTVHSICHALIKEHVFELGLSPDIEVSEGSSEGELDPALSKAISEAASEIGQDELDRLSARFEGWSWEEPVQQIITQAQVNNIDTDLFERFKERSLEGLLALLGPPRRDSRRIDQQLERRLVPFIEELRTDLSKKNTRGALGTAEKALKDLQSPNGLPWPGWARLSKIAPSADFKDATAVLREAAVMHDVHPALREDLQSAIDVVFDLARLAISRYRRYKEERGVLDYNDLENLALELLGRDTVQERLRGEIDLLLVDEFQDTSPIQLAIFLRLASLAKRCVWVGDQKQSIYRFRGADPALMDAVIARLQEERSVESLPRSYRSRPPLVDLVSDVFAAPFGRQGIPSERVRLTANRGDLAQELREPLERWNLDVGDAKKSAECKQAQQRAIAAGVAQLLADKSVSVLDKASNTARPVRPRDVAVLPYYNQDATDIANELRALGVPATVAGDSLLTTAEARFLLAAMRLWCAPGDTVAAGTLVRFLDDPEEPGRWLERATAEPRGGAFWSHPTVLAILDLARDEPGLGLLDGFDRLVEITGLRDLCRRWGNSARRLANLDALRIYVVSYIGSGNGDSSAALTPNGLLSYLQDYASEEGATTELDAVSVVNWHKTKGLEWPITVLSFDKRRPEIGAALGVSIATDAETIDLDRPLDDRWIRFWPNPYQKQRKDVPLFDRLEELPAAQAELEAATQEELRLLYVMLTRARDRLCLAAPANKLVGTGILDLLNPPEAERGDGETLPVRDVGPEATTLGWGRSAPPLLVRDCAAAEPVAVEIRADPGFDLVGAIPEYPPAYVAPSSVGENLALGNTGGATFGEPVVLGPPIAVTGSPQYDDLGNAIHAFLAADREGLSKKQRQVMAKRLLVGWGVADAVGVEDVLAASDRFRGWVEETFGDVRWLRESPLRGRTEAGPVLRGLADTILETPDGLVVVDHKTFRGGVEGASERAEKFIAQIAAYCDALAKTSPSKIVRGYVHLPLLGEIREVEL